MSSRITKTSTCILCSSSCTITNPLFVGSIEDGLELLLDRNLIKQFQEEAFLEGSSDNGSFFSLHRMVADAYLYSEPGLNGTFNASFDAACALVLALYPKKPNSTSHYGRFEEAKVALPHAVCLIDHFSSTQRRQNSLKASADFYNLVQHTTWFLRELGDYNSAVKYLEIGKAACNESSHFYGRYCLTEGLIMYERNDLPRCRISYGQVQQVYAVLLEPTHMGWSDHYNNVALLEYSEGRLEEAIEHFRLSDKIERAGRGQVDNVEQARFYMSIGRIYFVMGRLSEAEQQYSLAANEFALAGARKSELAAS